MIELNKIVRQQGDNCFTGLLKKVREGNLRKEDFEILCERIVDKSNVNYPADAVHIWAENAPVDNHNRQMLEHINEPCVTLIAHDQYPANVAHSDINKALERGRSGNEGLDCRIDLKVGARVMLTTNVDVEDRLINGQMDTVMKIKINHVSSKPEVVYVKFDDQNAGKLRIRKSADIYANTNEFVPVTSVLGRIKIKENRS